MKKKLNLFESNPKPDNEQNNTLFRKICELALAKDEAGIRTLIGNEGTVDIPKGNYFPVGLLAKKGEKEAVKFLIEKFNADRYHAVLCAMEACNVPLARSFVYHEHDEIKFKALLHYQTRGIIRGTVQSLSDKYSREEMNSLLLILGINRKNKLEYTPEEWKLINKSRNSLFIKAIDELVKNFPDFEKPWNSAYESRFSKSLPPGWCMDCFKFECQLSIVTQELKLDYFQAEEFLKNNNYPYLSDFSLLMNDYKLNYHHARSILVLSEGARLWLLQVGRQLVTGRYIDIDDNKCKSTHNDLQIPLEIWFHITSYILGIQEDDIVKITRTVNQLLHDEVVSNYQQNYKNSSSFIQKAFSFFNIKLIPKEQEELENRIGNADHRHQKRISFLGYN